jgi:exodeoxyribonuclease VII large subunit
MSTQPSQGSDALHDFREKYHGAGGKAEIHPLYAPVQGEDAAVRIADRTANANGSQEIDVIVLVRGGGTKADLSSYDDIRVAEAICHSRLPVVTGIGHQPDETIADQVADASTISPTDAADKLARLEPQELAQLITNPRIQAETQISQTNQTGIQSNINKVLLFMVALMTVVIFILLYLNFS